MEAWHNPHLASAQTVVQSTNDSDNTGQCRPAAGAIQRKSTNAPTARKCLRIIPHGEKRGGVKRSTARLNVNTRAERPAKTEYAPTVGRMYTSPVAIWMNHLTGIRSTTTSATSRVNRSGSVRTGGGRVTPNGVVGRVGSMLSEMRFQRTRSMTPRVRIDKRKTARAASADRNQRRGNWTSITSSPSQRVEQMVGGISWSFALPAIGGPKNTSDNTQRHFSTNSQIKREGWRQ